MATPIKPFKRFSILIEELDEDSAPTGKWTERIIEANGNPELFAKTGSFVRQFSEESIPEWRKRK